MKMKMVIELLIPGVQNGNKSHFAAKSVLRIPAKGMQGLRYRFEQDIEHDFFIVQDNRI